MSYDAVVAARKDAEAKMTEPVKEGIRLGLEMKRVREAEKAARSTYWNPKSVGYSDWPATASQPDEDAFMVPGMGYQPVPPEKCNPANDNRQSTWGGIDPELAAETFAPLERLKSVPPAKRTYSGMTAAQAAVYEHRITTQRRGSFMQTFTGRKFWPMDPRPQEVCIRDIAHSLSLQCRYAGHCRRFYSVAEHCVHIARWLVGVAPEDALWGLLHDASESYLIDVPRPVKPFLYGYKAAESKVMAAVCQRFGLPLAMPAAVHEADERIIADELVNLVRMQWHARHDDPLHVRLMYWSPAEAEEEFLATYTALTGEVV